MASRRPAGRVDVESGGCVQALRCDGGCLGYYDSCGIARCVLVDLLCNLPSSIMLSSARKQDHIDVRCCDDVPLSGLIWQASSQRAAHRPFSSFPQTQPRCRQGDLLISTRTLQVSVRPPPSSSHHKSTIRAKCLQTASSLSPSRSTPKGGEGTRTIEQGRQAQTPSHRRQRQVDIISCEGTPVRSSILP